MQQWLSIIKYFEKYTFPKDKIPRLFHMVCNNYSFERLNLRAHHIIGIRGYSKKKH
jgi:hypothetical protein